MTTEKPRTTRLGANYWKLWSASAVSNLGDGVSVVAYPWLASLLTRDPVLIAGLGAALRLPWLLVSLPAGAVVDRVDRRRLMVTANAVRFLVALSVAVAVAVDAMSLPLLYTSVLALGVAEVLYDNAAQTFLPSIVSADRLERANGNLYGAETILNRLAGPSLGGALITAAVAIPFFLDAATFGISALLIFLITGRFHTPAPIPARRAPGAAAAEATAQRARRSLRTEIAEGVAWLWRHRLLRTLAVNLGVANALDGVVLATLVLFAQEVLGLGAAGFGLLTAATAVGGILGSVLAPSVSRRIGPGPSLYSALLIGGTGAYALAGATSSPWVVGVGLATWGFASVLWDVITVSLRQTVIPDRLLGRVNSVYRLFGWGSIPLGTLLGGLIVAAAEPFVQRTAALRAPFLFAAAGYLVAYFVSLGRLSTASIEAARNEATQRDEAGE